MIGVQRRKRDRAPGRLCLEEANRADARCPQGLQKFAAFLASDEFAIGIGTAFALVFTAEPLARWWLS